MTTLVVARGKRLGSVESGESEQVVPAQCAVAPSSHPSLFRRRKPDDSKSCHHLGRVVSLKKGGSTRGRDLMRLPERDDAPIMRACSSSLSSSLSCAKKKSHSHSHSEWPCAQIVRTGWETSTQFAFRLMSECEPECDCEFKNCALVALAVAFGFGSKY
jgi:hypothetical protein